MSIVRNFIVGALVLTKAFSPTIASAASDQELGDAALQAYNNNESTRNLKLLAAIGDEQIVAVASDKKPHSVRIPGRDGPSNSGITVLVGTMKGGEAFLKAEASLQMVDVPLSPEGAYEGEAPVAFEPMKKITNVESLIAAAKKPATTKGNSAAKRNRVVEALKRLQDYAESILVTAAACNGKKPKGDRDAMPDLSAPSSSKGTPKPKVQFNLSCTKPLTLTRAFLNHAKHRTHGHGFSAFGTAGFG